MQNVIECVTSIQENTVYAKCYRMCGLLFKKILCMQNVIECVTSIQEHIVYAKCYIMCDFYSRK